MNIEHCDLLSWFHERHARPAHKNHAQDCGTLIALRISARRSCHGLDVHYGFHPSGCCGPKLSKLSTRATDTCPSTPSRRSAAGRASVLSMNSSTKTFLSHARCEPLEGPHPGYARLLEETSQKRAREARVVPAQRRMLCFSSSAL